MKSLDQDYTMPKASLIQSNLGSETSLLQSGQGHYRRDRTKCNNEALSLPGSRLPRPSPEKRIRRGVSSLDRDREKKYGRADHFSSSLGGAKENIVRRQRETLPGAACRRNSPPDGRTEYSDDTMAPLGGSVVVSDTYSWSKLDFSQLREEDQVSRTEVVLSMRQSNVIRSPRVYDSIAPTSGLENVREPHKSRVQQVTVGPIETDSICDVFFPSDELTTNYSSSTVKPDLKQRDSRTILQTEKRAKSLLPQSIIRTKNQRSPRTTVKSSFKEPGRAVRQKENQITAVSSQTGKNLPESRLTNSALELRHTSPKIRPQSQKSDLSPRVGNLDRKLGFTHEFGARLIPVQSIEYGRQKRLSNFIHSTPITKQKAFQKNHEEMLKQADMDHLVNQRFLAGLKASEKSFASGLRGMKGTAPTDNDLDTEGSEPSTSVTRPSNSIHGKSTDLFSESPFSQPDELSQGRSLNLSDSLHVSELDNDVELGRKEILQEYTGHHPYHHDDHISSYRSNHLPIGIHDDQFESLGFVQSREAYGSYSEDTDSRFLNNAPRRQVHFKEPISVSRKILPIITMEELGFHSDQEDTELKMSTGDSSSSKLKTELMKGTSKFSGNAHASLKFQTKSVKHNQSKAEPKLNSILHSHKRKMEVSQKSQASSSVIPGALTTSILLNKQPGNTASSSIERSNLRHPNSISRQRDPVGELRDLRLQRVIEQSPLKDRTDVILKLRHFRQWRQNVRLLKVVRERERLRIMKAASFYNLTSIAKHFYAWRTFILKQQIAADELYSNHLLKKGFIALRWAASMKKFRTEQVVFGRQRIKLRSCFTKWKTRYDFRRIKMLRKKFSQWVTRYRDQRIIKAFDERREINVSRLVFYSWQDKFYGSIHQRLAIRHYNSVIARKVWHMWRIYTAERIVQNSQVEVAEIKQESWILSRYLEMWKRTTIQIQFAKIYNSKKILTGRLKQWKHSVSLLRIHHQKEINTARRARRKHLIQSHFNTWVTEMKMKSFKHERERRTISRCVLLWKSQVERHRIIFAEVSAHRLQVLLRKSFYSIQDYARTKKQNRLQAVEKIEALLAHQTLAFWHRFTLRKIMLRNMQKTHCVTRNKTNMQGLFLIWRSKLQHILDVREHQRQWTLNCVLIAADKWIKLLRLKQMKRSCDKEIERGQKRRLKGAFRTWKLQLQRERRSDERGAECRVILLREQMRRILRHWNICAQESANVRPFLEKMDRKKAARYFDAWTLLKNHRVWMQNMNNNIEKSTTVTCFIVWKEKWNRMKRMDHAAEKYEELLKKSALRGWKKHMYRCHGYAIVSNQRNRMLLLETFFIWATKTSYKQMEQSKKLHQDFLERTNAHEMLIRWRNKALQHRADLEESIERFREEQTLSQRKSFFNQWTEAFRNQQKAKGFASENTKKRIRAILHEWHTAMNEIMQERLENFTLSLQKQSSKLQNASKSTQNDVLMGYNAETQTNFRNLDIGGSILEATRVEQLLHNGSSGKEVKSAHAERYSDFHEHASKFPYVEPSVKHSHSDPDTFSILSSLSTDNGTRISDDSSVAVGNGADSGILVRDYIFTATISAENGDSRNISLDSNMEMDSLLPVTDDKPLVLEDLTKSISTAGDTSTLSSVTNDETCSLLSSTTKSTQSSALPPSGDPFLQPVLSDLSHMSSLPIDENFVWSREVACGNEIQSNFIGDGLEISYDNGIDHEVSQTEEAEEKNEETVKNWVNDDRSIENGNGYEEYAISHIMQENGTDFFHTQNVDRETDMGNNVCEDVEGNTVWGDEFDGNTSLKLLQKDHADKVMGNTGLGTLNSGIGNTDQAVLSNGDHIQTAEVVTPRLLCDRDTLTQLDPDDSNSNISSESSDVASSVDDVINDVIEPMTMEVLRRKPRPLLPIHHGLKDPAISTTEWLVRLAVIRLRYRPLAFTFHQWKLLVHAKNWNQDMMSHMKDRRAKLMLRQHFRYWKTKSTSIVKARNHYNETMRRRWFGLWALWTTDNQRRQSNLCLLKDARRLMKLGTVFDIWKQKLKRKMSLMEILYYWQTRAKKHISPSGKDIKDRQKKNHELSTKCFLQWKALTEQCAKANMHRERVLVMRCFSAWNSWTVENISMSRNCEKLKAKRIKRNVINAWRSHVLLMRIVKAKENTATRNRISSMMLRWNSYTQLKKSHRSSLCQLSQLSRVKTLETCFNTWNLEWTKCKLADVMHRRVLMRKFIHAWHDVIIEEVDNRRKLVQIKQMVEAHNKMEIFKLWRQQMLCESKISSVRSQHYRNLVIKYWILWKDNVALKRAFQAYSRFLMNRYLQNWKKFHDLKKKSNEKVRIVLRKWHDMVTKNQLLSAMADEFKSRARIYMLEVTFNTWIIANRQSLNARVHHKKKLMRSVLSSWNAWSTQKRRLKKMQLNFQRQRKKELFAISWHKWKYRHQVWIRNSDVIYEQKKIVAFRNLRNYWRVWREKTQENLADKTYRNSLVNQAFAKWRCRHEKILKADRLVKEHQERRTIQILFSWRSYTLQVAEERKIISELCESRNRILVISTFMNWLKSCKNQGISCAFKERRLKEKCFSSLRTWNADQKRLATCYSQAVQLVETTILKVYFNHWKMVYRKSRMLEVSCDKILEDKKFKMMKEKWKVWFKAKEKRDLLQRRERDLTSDTIKKWRSYATNRVQKRRIKTERSITVEKFKERWICKRALGKWHREYKARWFDYRRRMNILNRTWMLWSTRTTMNIYASKMHQLKTLDRCWYAWRLELVMKKTTDREVENRKCDFIRKVFRNWRIYTYERRTGHRYYAMTVSPKPSENITPRKRSRIPVLKK